VPDATPAHLMALIRYLAPTLASAKINRDRPDVLSRALLVGN